MSYLEKCQGQVRELQQLYSDYVAIANNDSVDMEHRYQLVMADACFGRIKQLFKEIGVDFYLQHDNIPRILGYQSCISLTETEIRWRLESLEGLLPQE